MTVIANYGVTTHELRELREPHKYPITSGCRLENHFNGIGYLTALPLAVWIPSLLHQKDTELLSLALVPLGKLATGNYCAIHC